MSLSYKDSGETSADLNPLAGGKSRMREIRPYGSVRGTAKPYPDRDNNSSGAKHRKASQPWFGTRLRIAPARTPMAMHWLSSPAQVSPAALQAAVPCESADWEPRQLNEKVAAQVSLRPSLRPPPDLKCRVRFGLVL
jgi:hypothetical protein